MQIMWQILAVAAGGACGALSRWGITIGMQRLAGKSFPWGTFAANMLGCFLIGICVVWAIERKPPAPLELAIITGGLGALTTFSAFSNDTLALLIDHRPAAAMANVALSVMIGLAAAWSGMQVGKAVF